MTQIKSVYTTKHLHQRETVYLCIFIMGWITQIGETLDEGFPWPSQVKSQAFGVLQSALLADS